MAQRFLDHGTRAEVLADLGLTAQDVARRVTEWAVGRLGEAAGQVEPVPEQQSER